MYGWPFLTREIVIDSGDSSIGFHHRHGIDDSCHRS